MNSNCIKKIKVGDRLEFIYYGQIISGEVIEIYRLLEKWKFGHYFNQKRVKLQTPNAIVDIASDTIYSRKEIRNSLKIIKGNSK